MAHPLGSLHSGSTRRGRHLWLLGFLLVCPLGLGLARHKALQHYQYCTTQIGMVYASAVEMYGQDWGEYPAHPQQLLAGGYLRRLPTCPSAGCVSYEYRQTSGGYQLRCPGHCHALAAWLRAAPSQPVYDSETGLGWE